MVLHWLAWQPTPYNDALFRAIDRDGSFDLTVHYRTVCAASHPWQAPLRSGYRSRVYHGEGLRFDASLLRLATRRRPGLFVLSGWPGLTAKAILCLLAARRLPFLFWTDTPKLQMVPSGTGRAHPVEEFETGVPYGLAHAKLRRALYRLVFRHAGAVMATGEPGIGAYRTLGCSPAKLISLPYFVELPGDIPRMELERKYGAFGPFAFAATGQFVPRKGYDVAVKALSLVQKRGVRPCTLVLMGDGPGRGELERLCATEGVQGRVGLAGWQEPDEVTDTLRSSQGFLHPARQEPYGVAVLEAMACGLPVLGSAATCAVRDRVVPGQNGFIHESGNAGMLAEHMVALLSNPAQAAEMACNARRTAEAWPPSRGVQILKEAVARCGQPATLDGAVGTV